MIICKLLQITLFAITLLMSNIPTYVSAWACQNVCGGIPVQYPFGTGRDCGSQLFQNYVNCTHGKLQLYFPTGVYTVQSIDYLNNIIIIEDPHMSTCSSMKRSSSFGIPVGAPFTIVSTTIVLLGCSSSYNPTSICDPSGAHICSTLLYSCPGVSGLSLSNTAPLSSCCVYSSSQLSTQPFQINLPLLQCSSYTSIYSFGSDKGHSQLSYSNPNTWQYGIALRYMYDKAAYYNNCKLCQQTNGVCAYNLYGFVCVCGTGFNTTTHCYGGIYNGAQASWSKYEAALAGGVSALIATFLLGLS